MCFKIVLKWHGVFFITLVKSCSLYADLDLEKAFDRVPREVIRWAMRKLGVKNG